MRQSASRLGWGVCATLIFGSWLPALGAAAGTKPSTIDICVPVFKEELLTAEVLLAEERGFFKDAGLNVRVNLVAGHDVSRGGDRELFAAATSDTSRCRFATSSIEDLLVSGVDLAKLEPLYVYLYGKSYDTHLVVAKDSPIRSVADLKGKRIRVGQIPTQIALQGILHDAGLTLKDVEIVPGAKMSPPAILPALEKGELQAAISYYPTMAMMLSSGKVRVLKENVFRNYVLPNVPHSFVAVNAAFAQKNPEVVKSFRTALLRADEEVRKHPAALVSVIGHRARFLGLTGWESDPVLAERASDLIRGLHLSEIASEAYGGLTVLEALERFGTLLKEKNYLAGTPDWSAWKRFGGTQGQKTARR